MHLQRRFFCHLGLVLIANLAIATSRGETPVVDAPRPTPVTRPAMKRMLEGMKTRQERIPLPDPTDPIKAAA